MANVIDFIISGIMDCFDILRNFEFLGTNMLTFCITIAVIGVLLPIIFTIGRGFIIPNEAKNTREEYVPKHSHWYTRNQRAARGASQSGLTREAWNKVKHRG